MTQGIKRSIRRSDYEEQNCIVLGRMGIAGTTSKWWVVEMVGKWEEMQ